MDTDELFMLYKKEHEAARVCGAPSGTVSTTGSPSTPIFASKDSVDSLDNYIMTPVNT
jgi:hypothetical protein